MIKKIGFLLFLLTAFTVFSVSAGATILTSHTNKIFFNNYETVFRADNNGQYHEIDQTGGPANIAVGDIFVGIINVQDITDINNIVVWNQPGGDQLTGVFAQQVTNIAPGGQGLILDLAPTSVNTFYPLLGSSFNTGLASNEMFKIYLDNGGSTPFTTGGTIADGVAAATNGSTWMSLGDADTTVIPYTTFNATSNGTATGTPSNTEEYTWSDVTPFGTPFVDFAGEAYIGLSVITYQGLAGYPLLNDPTETRFDTDVQFYANSELTVNPDFKGFGGPQNWVFESNDPARVNAVPEPATLLLLGLGLLGSAALTRKRLKS